MNVKDQAIAAIRRLPDDADIRDIEEEIALLHAIQEAEEDIASGNLVDNSDMRSRIQEWSTN